MSTLWNQGQNHDPNELEKRLAKELAQLTWKERIGRCYELAFKFVIAHSQYSLIHGSFPTGDGHAWAEDDEGNVVDLTQPDPFVERWRFYEVLDVETEAIYDAETAMRNAVKWAEYGPWHRADSKKS